MVVEQTTVNRIDFRTSKRAETSLHEFFSFPDGQIFPMVRRKDNHSALLHTFINSYNAGKKPVFLSQITKLYEYNEATGHRLKAPEAKKKALSAIGVLRSTLGEHVSWSIQLLNSLHDVGANKDLDLSWTLNQKKEPVLPNNTKKYCVSLIDGSEFKPKSPFDRALVEKSKQGTTLEKLEEIFGDYTKEKSYDVDTIQKMVVKHIEKLNLELKKRDIWLSVCLRSPFEKPETKHPVQMIKIPTSSQELQSPKV